MENSDNRKEKASKKTEESRHIASIAAAFMDELTAITAADARPTVETEVRSNAVRSITCTVNGGPVSYRFIYTVQVPFGGKRSTLEARIYYPQISCDVGLSPYDLADKLGDDYFTCFIYPMIESPERMRLIVRGMVAELSRLSGCFRSFYDDGTAARLIEKKEAEIADTLRAGDILKNGTPDDRARVLSMYYLWYAAKMTSGVYQAFAEGKTRRASSLAAKQGASDYEAAIGRYIEKTDGDYPSPCADGGNTFADFAKTQKKNSISDFGRFLLSCLALVPLMMIAFALVYGLVAWICSRGAYYSTMTELYNIFLVIPPALLTAACLSFFLCERMAKKTKDEAEKNYRLIMSSPRTNGCMTVFTNIAAVASIIATALMASSGIVMTDRGIVDSSSLLTGGTLYTYDVIGSFEYEADAGDGYCHACVKLKNGKTLDLGYIGAKSVSEKIVPEIKKYGTAIINIPSEE